MDDREMKRLEELLEKAIEEDRGVIARAKEVEFVKEDFVLVKAHYRKINGKRVYVKPYWRRRRKK